MTGQRITFLDEKKKEIIQEYVRDRLSTIQIGWLYKVSSSTIERRLHLWKIPVRKRAWEINDSAFSTRTPDSCYWTGYMLGDGNIESGSSRFKISSKDYEHLIKFSRFLSDDSPYHSPRLQTRNSPFRVYTIGYESKRICADLRRVGITPKKSLTVYVKEKHLLRSIDFWRGVYDSDGTLGLYPKSYSLVLSIHTGSNLFARQAQRALKILFGVPPAVYRNRNGYNIVFSGKKIIPIIEQIYNTKVGTVLDRKQIIATDILKRCGNGQLWKYQDVE